MINKYVIYIIYLFRKVSLKVNMKNHVVAIHGNNIEIEYDCYKRVKL